MSRHDHIIISIKRMKSTFLFLCLALAWFHGSGLSQTVHSITYDPGLSPISGAFSLAAFHRGVSALQTKVIPNRWTDERTAGQKIIGIAYRLSKTVLVDNVGDHLIFLLQHEFFGHGARYREFGYRHNSYRFHLVFPYGDSLGWAFRGIPEPGRINTRHEDLAMIAGGFEAEALLAREILGNWAAGGVIPVRETVLYLFASTGLSSYILRTRLGWRSSAGNDVLAYLGAINREAQIPGISAGELTLDHLARRATVSFANPVLYFSLYGFLYHYLLLGRETMDLPMISIGCLEMIPFLRLQLSPFGPETSVESFVALAGKIGHIYARFGRANEQKTAGVGLMLMNLIKKHHMCLEARVDIWKQPPLLLGTEEIRETRGGIGAGVKARLFIRLIDKPFPIGIVAQAGYKTDGYLEGEPLSRGLIVRMGIGILTIHSRRNSSLRFSPGGRPPGAKGDKA